MVKFKILILIILWGSLSQLYAGTTGKISGRILDATTGDPLAGANVFLEGTSLGAAANLDGYYVILNVPPGNYTMKASMIGYSTYTIINVRVNIDLTSTVNFNMQSTVVSISGEVTVVAERPVVQKDISASQANIEEIGRAHV